MCTSCLTQASAMVVPAGLGAMAWRHRIQAWWSTRRGASPHDRALAEWERSAASLRAMGYDPELVLGPPPTSTAAPAPS